MDQGLPSGTVAIQFEANLERAQTSVDEPRGLTSCLSSSLVLHFRHEVIRPDERRNVLSRRDLLLCAHAFWREERFGLEHFISCLLQVPTARNRTGWWVFYFWPEFGVLA